VKIIMNRTATILSCTCPICGKHGTIRAIEVLPKNGMSMECIHQDGSDHTWAEYDSMEAVISKNIRGKEPKIIVCPVCNKRGRVNGYHPHDSAPNIVEYLVTHEKIKGTWGKSKVSKRRRCYIKKAKDRETILKKLGFYIPHHKLNSLERYIEK
jgi:hypothetical protein